MNLFRKIPTTAFIIILLFGSSGTYLACNKGSATATTIIKCVTCLHGGSCINDSCRCPAGYSGTACQTSVRTLFARQWQVSETSTLSGTLRQYNLNIESLNIDDTAVYVLGLYESFYDLTGYVSGDTLFIPRQTTNNETIVGYGILHSGPGGANTAVTMRYQVTDNSTGTVDDYGYNATDGSQPSQWQAQ
jgi:hypothetical protein